MREPNSDDRLMRAYEALRDVFESANETGEVDPPPFYAPALPPVDPGSRLSATDLLSWWFRPPSAQKDPWQSFFARFTESSGAATGAPSAPAPGETHAGWAGLHNASPKALARVLFPEPEDDLASEDADAAIEVFYEFLHAFGRHDIDGAMQYVSEDYHTFENDCEMNRADLRNALTALLDSLHGWNFTVSLSMVPEALRHPYGVIVYAEIQVDGVHPATREKRNLVERKLVRLEQQTDSAWRIAALSPVRESHQ